jgi:hypothetical protein
MSGKLSFKLFRRKKRLANLRTIITNLWAPLVLVTISLIISFLNYQPGTWLTGWDNLHTEFLPLTNIKRAVFTVWQEYQGLGLLGGMAHAADLPRQIFFLILKLFSVPDQNLRYIYIFSMLTIGPLGVYFFIKDLLLKQKSIFLTFDKETKTFAALLGALFYLLNLSTVQTFFVPFETFTAFFGFFPWLLLVTINYLKQPNRRHYLYLIITYLLATPAFYVETLFVVLALCLLPCLAIASKTKTSLFTSLSIFITQAFWLLPVVFFVLTNGHVGEQAKINLISTPETYVRNLEFSNLKDLSLLKGYLMNFLDLGIDGKFTYLLLPWRQHLQNPLINLLGYLNFILVLTGIYYALKRKLKLAPIVLSITIICLFFLLGGGLLINSQIPLIGELFRSPFTKFSTPLAFTYAVFFSVGCIFILDLFSFLHHKLTYLFTLFTIALSLLIFMSPVFSGQLISSDMRLKIPQEYFDTFEFFENQDPNTRIANFPQYTFWGWNFYSWGYRGSGFLWYGIKQPILDRAFDVWEKQNENYYQEINTALYSGDQEKFENIIEKYAINWILIDRFVISPQENQDLKNQQLISMLNASNNFKLEKNINNNILIYKSNTDKRINNYLELTTSTNTQTKPFENLSLRPNTNWTASKGSDPSRSDSSRGSLDYQIKEGSYPNGTITLPSYTTTENLVPVEISYRKLSNQILLKFSPLLPSINSITPQSTPNYIYLDISSFQSSLIIEIDKKYFELTLPNELITQPIFYPLTSMYLPTRNTININAYTNSPTKVVNVTSALKDALPYQCYTNKNDRKIEKITFSNSISLLGTDIVGCLSLPLPSFIPPGLVSTQYTYFSSTSTPANSNVTTSNLSFSTTPPQPLNPEILPTTTRQFSPLTLERQQLNLILEANGTNSVQEITYQNITTNFHPLLANTSFQLNSIPATKVQNPKKASPTSISLPIINSSLNITQTPEKNQLLPKARNCNQFRSGTFSKTFTNKTINYFAQDATTCDSLDLRHLPHSTNYLIQIDHQHLEGMPMTLCLENHSTQRCDVFERLQNTTSTQSIIQPISNPDESKGYTLHLYNQSVGNRPTTTNLNSIHITPIPLNFIQNISTKDSPPKTKDELNPKTTFSSHPTEFLYTISTQNQTTLNLYQTYSPYWVAISTNQDTLKLPLFQLILKTPFLYLKDGSISQKGFSSDSGPLSSDRTSSDVEPNNWNNSWQLPPREHHLVIVYLPQYLEFLGFALLPTLPLIYLLNRKK